MRSARWWPRYRLLLVWLWCSTHSSVFRRGDERGVPSSTTLLSSSTSSFVFADASPDVVTALAGASSPHLVPGSPAAAALKEQGIVHYNPSLLPGVNATHFFEHPLVPYTGGSAARRAQAMHNMLDWLGRGGAYFPKVGLQPDPSTGGGGVSLEDIARNEMFMKIPRDLMIHPTMASKANPLTRILQSHWEVFSLEQAYNKDKVILSFFIVAEMLRSRKHQCSPFQPYLDHLPDSYRGFPVFWDDHDMSFLQNSSFIKDVVAERERLEDDFHRACKLWNMHKASVRASAHTASSEDREFEFDCDEDNMILPHHVEPTCWHVRTSDRPTCRGYEGAGYTCVGDRCAAIDPRGDPHLCARLAPRGYVLDKISGTCVRPKKAGHDISQTSASSGGEGLDDDDLEWEKWLMKERANGKIPDDREEVGGGSGRSGGGDSVDMNKYANENNNPSATPLPSFSSVPTGLDHPPMFAPRTCSSPDSRPVGDRTHWSVFHWYMWARLVVSSRSWRIYPNGRVSSKNQKNTSEYSSLALVPLADNLNHALEPGTLWTFDAKLDSFTIKATRKLSGLESVLDSYGPKKNSRFLLSFGFISNEAPDQVKLQFPPTSADVSHLLYDDFSRRQGSEHGVTHPSYPLSPEAVPVIRNLISGLEEMRDGEWGRRAKEYALTSDIDSSAATLVTSILISKDAMNLKNPSQESTAPSIVWTARVIAAVSSMRLSMYPTNSAQDSEILKSDLALTWWQQNAIKLRRGEKEVLRAWARFGVVLAHNHMSRPNRITVALTLSFDGKVSPAFRLHSDVLPALFRKGTGASQEPAEEVDGVDSRVLSRMVVGTPVFAQWAGNGQYYDGVIIARAPRVTKDGKVKKKRIKTANVGPEDQAYVVQFFDGDFQPATLGRKILAFPQNFLDSPEYEGALMQMAQDVPSGLEGTCFTATKDYWTYEVCISGTIKQYHKKPDGSRSSVTLLGKYTDTTAITLRCRFGTCLEDKNSGGGKGASNTYQRKVKTEVADQETRAADISTSSAAEGGRKDHENQHPYSHPHVYRQEFHQGESGRSAEILFVCRKEKKGTVRQMALRGESHALADITGTGLVGNSVRRDAQRRTREWSLQHTGRLLSIEEPRLLRYQIVIGTEAACPGLVTASSYIEEDLVKTNDRVESLWQKTNTMGSVPWGVAGRLKRSSTSRDINGILGGGDGGQRAGESDRAFYASPLSYRNLDSVMCVISRSDNSKSYAMASITAAHNDGTFDVKFDSKFSTRTRVPVDDILPVPKQLMSLPCWLFNEVPGAGCL